MNYAATAKTADRIIAKQGATASLTYAQTGAYNPTTGGVGTSAPATVDVRAVMFDYAEILINGSTIMVGDKQVYISAVGVSIDPQITGDLMFPKVGGNLYKIIKVKPLSPAGIDVLYELQVRR